MVCGERGIAAAVGLQARLVILQSADEGQDRRFVVGQADVADGHAEQIVMGLGTSMATFDRLRVRLAVFPHAELAEA
jgi:hypothetical protein